MSRLRLGLMLVSAAIVVCAATGGAQARRYHHRHYVVHRVVHTFVFRSPESAAVTADSGKFAGYFLPGILGASTADPYEHPSYGYYVGGGYGPGYSYYGD